MISEIVFNLVYLRRSFRFVNNSVFGVVKAHLIVKRFCELSRNLIYSALPPITPVYLQHILVNYGQSLIKNSFLSLETEKTKYIKYLW